ncbi:MAG: hypothetical protein ACR2QR_03885 [Woeseiaceae bacterium]
MTNTGKRWDQRFYAVLWAWMAFKTLIPWLVFFRLTLEGDSYRWGTQFFGRGFYSSGFARADFLLIYGLLAAGLVILWTMRQRRFSIAGPLLFLFLGIMAADAAYQFIRGVPIIFQGDTLGINLDISIPFYGLQFLMFVVAAAWWYGVRNMHPDRPARPAGHRRVIVFVCVLYIPLQIALLMLGEPHGLTDVIGVIGTLIQWGLLAYAWYPGSNY